MHDYTSAATVTLRMIMEEGTEKPHRLWILIFGKVFKLQCNLWNQAACLSLLAYAAQKWNHVYSSEVVYGDASWPTYIMWHT